MGVLAGPYLAAAALLAVSGLLKLRQPAASARALERRGLRPLVALAPFLAAAEVVVGLGALTVDRRAFPALAAAFYLAFSAFVGLALTADGPGADCGCFGAVETPPTTLHLVLNLAAAGVCGAVAFGSGGSVGRALHDQPLLGVPLLLLAGTCAALAYAALTVLPRARATAQP